MKSIVTEEMVGRFLGWKLPENFAPDCYISYDRESAQKYNGHPTGTNLLHAGQAREMLEHVMPASKVLLEHSGCGQGTQVEQLTVRLNPGDKVVLLMGPYSAAMAKSQSPD